jgi:hypothetical protein
MMQNKIIYHDPSIDRWLILHESLIKYKQYILPSADIVLHPTKPLQGLPASALRMNAFMTKLQTLEMIPTSTLRKHFALNPTIQE